jgi:hypothetical protein
MVDNMPNGETVPLKPQERIVFYTNNLGENMNRSLNRYIYAHDFE